MVGLGVGLDEIVCREIDILPVALHCWWEVTVTIGIQCCYFWLVKRDPVFHLKKRTRWYISTCFDYKAQTNLSDIVDACFIYRFIPCHAIRCRRKEVRYGPKLWFDFISQITKGLSEKVLSRNYSEKYTHYRAFYSFFHFCLQTSETDTYPITKAIVAEFCVVPEVVNSGLVQPATIILESLWQVPVEQGYHWRDTWQVNNNNNNNNSNNNEAHSLFWRVYRTNVSTDKPVI